MQITAHFNLSEFLVSDKAKEMNINLSDYINDDIINNIITLCVNLLEPVRIKFGLPISINSGFRNNLVNNAVKGSKDSDHIFGRAADINNLSGKNDELFEIIKNNYKYKQLIWYETGNNYPEWIHVSYDINNLKCETLICRIAKDCKKEYIRI